MTFLYVYIGSESDTKLTEKPEFCDFKYINYSQNTAYRNSTSSISRRQEICSLGHVAEAW